MSKNIFCIVILFTSVLLIGCGISKVVEQKATIIEMQRPVIVEKTGEDKRPDWTTDKPFFRMVRGSILQADIWEGRIMPLGDCPRNIA